MPKASKGTTSETVRVEGYEGHIENFEGGYTVAFEKYTADADLTPFFKGLPNDQCQAAHWGYAMTARTRSSRPMATRPSRLETPTTSVRVTHPCCTHEPRRWSSVRRRSCTRRSKSSAATWKREPEQPEVANLLHAARTLEDRGGDPGPTAVEVP
jgi:hypothetical protein